MQNTTDAIRRIEASMRILNDRMHRAAGDLDCTKNGPSQPRSSHSGAGGKRSPGISVKIQHHRIG